MECSYNQFFTETQNELITKLEELVKDFVEPINQAGEHSTSELESFHSCLNRNAPKMEGFSYSGMKSRYVTDTTHYCCNDGISINLPTIS